MNRFVFVVLVLTFGGIAGAQDLWLGTTNVVGRGRMSVLLVPKGDERCAVEIRDSHGSRVQEIEPEGLDCKEQSWTQSLTTKDMNFDGFADFGFTTNCGNRGCGCIWFLYNPVSSQFEASPALANVSCDVQLDRKAKTLAFRSRGSVAGEELETYQWKDRELVLVREERNLIFSGDAEPKVCVITQIVRELKGAGMAEVSRTCTLNGDRDGKRCSCDGAVGGF